MNIRCRHCGADTPDYAKYCIKCGAEVDDLGAPRDTMIYTDSSVGDGESPVYTDFGGAIKLFFKNYIDFNGRSTRSEYWYAYLFLFIVNAVLEIFKRTTGLGLPRLIWDLAIITPLMSIGFRRLHDIGKSGAICLAATISVFVWAFATGIMAGAAEASGRMSGGLFMFWLLASIITLILAIYMIVLFCQPSQIRDNSYGRAPHR
ncbi:MAG: DUF805 domain-containing protein [Ruminococcus sp.]|nr:DUF805 domain-containing protein [Ruminococcus sp.]